MKEVWINQTEKEILVAVLEDGRIFDLHIEPVEDRSILGSVYAGVVRNVLPGMQAAFVDVGLKKNAYLYVEDAMNREHLYETQTEGTKVDIGTYVRVGQPLLVQVKKTPVNGKGARVTTDITLPGRYIVMMPCNGYVGVSKKITDPEERDRLKEMAQNIMQGDMGIVVRTAAQGCVIEDIEQDYLRLKDIWLEIQEDYENIKGRIGLVREDIDFAMRILRDVILDDVDQIVTDEASYESVRSYVNRFIPRLAKHIKKKSEDSWQDDRVLEMVARGLDRKVWLKNGSYLVIDQVEALTAIDVNTGKFTGKKSLEDTAFETNLMAAREVARQLRLRNIGGMIIVDFIDMKKDEHRRELVRVLEEEVLRDPLKVQILGITRLGLMEMTRKKTKRSVREILGKTCPVCSGSGSVLLEEFVLRIIERRIRDASKRLTSDTLYVHVHPQILHFIQKKKMNLCQHWEEKYHKQFVLDENEELFYSEFSVHGEK